MSQKHIGLGLTGDHTEREPMWGGTLDRDIAAISHMAFPSLKMIAPQTSPPSAVDGDMYIVGTGSGWGLLPDGTTARGGIAVRDLGKWYYYAVQAGMTVHVQDTNSLWLYSGGVWQQAFAPPVWFKSYRNTNAVGEFFNSGNGILRTDTNYEQVSSSSQPDPFNLDGTCRIPGLYQINAQITFNVPDSATAQILAAYLNLSGTGARRLATKETLIQNESTNESLSLSTLVQLELGNSISAHLSWQRGTINIFGNNGFTTLDILKVG